ncbi:hypothetical protein PCPL58_p3136 (plasmid) [Pseudomonas cerasi]|uniref:Uncharacterized protein n=1 Tax=Pseudomonas cerasi TaxID=1583341 RepID=A0A193SGT7_9PSED|nr:hypothetical protein PCPL58_p3136 [Pseudomonas cerasi]SOS30286.1 hypothetical protein PL963_P300008 [Pseudomonas cerasi]
MITDFKIPQFAAAGCPVHQLELLLVDRIQFRAIQRLEARIAKHLCSQVGIAQPSGQRFCDNKAVFKITEGCKCFHSVFSVNS